MILIKLIKGLCSICFGVLVESPSVAGVPQDDRGVSGKSSAPFIFSAILRAEMVSLKFCLHARVAHSRHRVLPVPVGLSRIPFFFCKHDGTLTVIDHWF